MANPSRPVTAALLIIGNEILSGRTQDANLAFLGERLNECGVRMKEARIVADEEAEIIAAVNALRARYDYLFTSGGIGPTHDDITAACIAKAFDLPLVENPQARQSLVDYYGEEHLNDRRLRMARTPRGARLIPNPISGAPGFIVDNVYVLAGIPKVLRAMVDALAADLVGGAKVLSQTVTVALPESVIAAALEAVERAHPGLEIGSYPFQSPRGYGVNVVLRSEAAATLERARVELDAALRALEPPGL